MTDNDFIDAIAREWLRLGGDAEGVYWSWGKLVHRIRELESESATWESPGRGVIEHEPDQTYGACD